MPNGIFVRSALLWPGLAFISGCNDQKKKKQQPKVNASSQEPAPCPEPKEITLEDAWKNKIHYTTDGSGKIRFDNMNCHDYGKLGLEFELRETETTFSYVKFSLHAICLVMEKQQERETSRNLKTVRQLALKALKIEGEDVENEDEFIVTESGNGEVTNVELAFHDEDLEKSYVKAFVFGRKEDWYYRLRDTYLILAYEEGLIPITWLDNLGNKIKLSLTKKKREGGATLYDHKAENLQCVLPVSPRCQNFTLEMKGKSNKKLFLLAMGTIMEGLCTICTYTNPKDFKDKALNAQIIQVIEAAPELSPFHRGNGKMAVKIMADFVLTNIKDRTDNQHNFKKFYRELLSNPDGEQAVGNNLNEGFFKLESKHKKLAISVLKESDGMFHIAGRGLKCGLQNIAKCDGNKFFKVRWSSSSPFREIPEREQKTPRQTPRQVTFGTADDIYVFETMTNLVHHKDDLIDTFCSICEIVNLLEMQSDFMKARRTRDQNAFKAKYEKVLPKLAKELNDMVLQSQNNQRAFKEILDTTFGPDFLQLVMGGLEPMLKDIEKRRAVTDTDIKKRRGAVTNTDTLILYV